MIYLFCMGVGLGGLIISTLTIMKNLSVKAKTNNIQYHPSEYFRDDWYNVAITIVLLLMMLIPVKYAPANTPEWMLLGPFLPAGYAANDFLNKILGFVNKRINAAIDYKTTIADKTTGTEGVPTPK